MEKVGVLTAQNITVHYELAGLGARVLAYIIDRVTLWGYVILVFMLMDLLNVYADWVRIVLIGFPVLFYFLLSEIFINGQSLGKLALKIKVTRTDGNQADIWNYLLRWVLRPIDNFMGIGLIAILITPKGQRLGDLAAGTTVISLKQRVTLQDTLATEIEEDHKPVYSQAMHLTDRQAELIKEVLYRNQGANRWELVDEMAEKVKEHLGITSTLRNYQFLQTVLRDYTHYASL